ncbi:putative phosphogluconate dehydrogenase (NADP(+)-dependent, decarboxylating) [Rosa chinensis]|uniref:Putative phosphogluconate dehydrogenase (NADP(+)-dependent, decarboxylating) n=1 Tax=Rosa chinensis TaxID=74649 RepID=A0A2P6S466_ROSCH|nr:putative phosphogluconate dehydrogenase (NADP(+)-dependent, decarboxylating) [Rosa chinensis]
MLFAPKDFVLSLSLQRPRSVIILVKAGAPVDQIIAALSAYMGSGDIIDGGNEWYENTERRIHEASTKGLIYLCMGVSGGVAG